jgi:hypothetical protein
MVTGTVAIKDTNPSQFTMVKNIDGRLLVNLEAFDFSAPARAIAFNFDQDTTYVQTKWALGVFVTPDSLKMMEEGYFTFDNLSKLIQMAEAQGFYVPESIKEPQFSLKEIGNILKEGDTKKLDSLTLNMTTKLRGDIINIATKNYGSLQSDVVNYLEKKLNLSLKPVDLNVV